MKKKKDFGGLTDAFGLDFCFVKLSVEFLWIVYPVARKVFGQIKFFRACGGKIGVF